MILAMHQPYFLPYIGYWQLIDAADLFLIADDYAYIKNGWIKRNRILIQGAPHYFGIGVQEDSYRLCNELTVSIDRPRMMNLLYEAYHKAPFYAAGMELVEEILACPERMLSEFLLNSIRVVCRELAIDTPIGRTSDYPGNSRFKREERVYDMCRRLNADTFINAIGGMALYDFGEFQKRGVELRFLRTDETAYRQYGGAFVGSLSILDAIMFNPVEDVRTMLSRRGWITGQNSY